MYAVTFKSKKEDMGVVYIPCTSKKQAVSMADAYYKKGYLNTKVVKQSDEILYIPNLVAR